MTGIGATARTGESCPASGIWKVLGTPSTTAPIARGNVMLRMTSPFGPTVLL